MKSFLRWFGLLCVVLAVVMPFFSPLWILALPLVLLGWAGVFLIVASKMMVPGGYMAVPLDSPTRPYVQAFADEMEKKLAVNRHKGDREGWLEDSPFSLFRRMDAEAMELIEAISACKPPSVISQEAADVANFAMMVSDSYAHQVAMNGGKAVAS